VEFVASQPLTDSASTAEVISRCCRVRLVMWPPPLARAAAARAAPRAAARAPRRAHADRQE
jgi:hypothetical protein